VSRRQLNSSKPLFLGIAVTFADRAVTAQPAAQVQQQGDISPDN